MGVNTGPKSGYRSHPDRIYAGDIPPGNGQPSQPDPSVSFAKEVAEAINITLGEFGIGANKLINGANQKCQANRYSDGLGVFVPNATFNYNNFLYADNNGLAFARAVLAPLVEAGVLAQSRLVNIDYDKKGNPAGRDVLERETPDMGLFFRVTDTHDSAALTQALEKAKSIAQQQLAAQAEGAQLIAGALGAHLNPASADHHKTNITYPPRHPNQGWEEKNPAPHMIEVKLGVGSDIRLLNDKSEEQLAQLEKLEKKGAIGLHKWKGKIFVHVADIEKLRELAGPDTKVESINPPKSARQR